MSDVVKISLCHGGLTREIVAQPGAVLREVLLRHDASPYRGRARWVNCGGLSICGTCKVRVREGEQWWERRSCQIRCFEDLTIEIE